MKTNSSNGVERVKKYRSNMRALGLRPVQIWVADTRSNDFAQSCAQQVNLIAQAENKDQSLDSFMDAAWMNIDGWEA